MIVYLRRIDGKLFDTHNGMSIIIADPLLLTMEDIQFN